MDRWIGKVALVTGVSSGIGETIAVTLVERGIKVIGLARRLEKMQEITKRLVNAKGIFYPIKCDVTNEQEVLEAFKHAKNNFGGVDILINNAGVAFPSTIIDGISDHYRTVLDVNVLAPSICTREATKSMRERETEGHIIFINSVLGHDCNKATHPLNLYQASKSAITVMSEMVAGEITKVNASIKVTSLSPGLVKTEMPIIDSFGGDKIFSALPHLNTQDVADAIVYILGTPPHVQVTELTIQALHAGSVGDWSNIK